MRPKILFRPISLKTMEAVVWTIRENPTVASYFANRTVEQRCCIFYSNLQSCIYGSIYELIIKIDYLL